MLVFSLMTGGKAFTGQGCLQGTMLPLTGMGTPVGKVSSVELNRKKEEVSKPGVKVIRESLFTGITVRELGISCTFKFVGTTLGSPAGIVLGGDTFSVGMKLYFSGKHLFTRFNKLILRMF